MRFSLYRYRDDNERRLEEFAKKHWPSIRTSLLNSSLSEDECADVFQESLIVLWKNIRENKVESKILDLSYSAYFWKICNNKKRKEALVRDIVKDLPSPCNELLWGYYGDGHSMKTLAEMFDYASVNAVKVTKHRCCEKFRKRYSEMVKSLF